MKKVAAANSLALISEIIGFDLGHGETSIARASVTGQTEPEVLTLFGRKNQITAIARRKVDQVSATTDGEIKIISGEDEILLGEDAVNARGMRELAIGFKSRPDDNPVSRKLLRDYVQAVHDYLTQTAQVGRSGAYHLFVGCPSGWKEDVELLAYEALLRESGVNNLTVVRESHAALVHAKESGYLTVDQLKGPILVIDVGSSTTDFTFSKDRQSDSMSDGYDLGGAMIDRALLSELLSAQADRAEIEALFRQSEVHLNRCLLKCRRAKEAYFSNPGQFRTGHYEESVKLQKVRFEIELDAATMEKVLAKPLPELAGRTWEQAFRDATTNARHDWIDGKRLKTGVILATGGASRMGFVKKVCEDVFTGWEYKLGAEPEHSISRGLARWGRVVASTQGFDDDIRQLLENEIPRIVKAALPKLINVLAAAYSDEVVAKVIKKGLKDWRAGNVKALNDLEGHMQTLAKAWAESDAVKAILKAKADDWLKPIQEELYDLGKPICDKYGLHYSVLRLKGVQYTPSTTSPEIPAVGDPTTISDIVAAVVLVVIAAIVVITITSAAVTGPMGWVAVGAAILAAGGIEKWARTGDMPVWMRKQVLSLEKIEKVGNENRVTVRDKNQASLDSDESFKRQFTGNIIATLKDSLETRIREARLLIK